MANAPRMYVQDVWNDTATNSISQVGGNSQGVVVGDTFKDRNTGNTIRIVSRDESKTMIEKDTGKGVESETISNALTDELSSIVDEIEATLPAAGVDFEMKRTGVGLSLNMPFSTGLDSPATETKNTAESGVKNSESGSDVLQNQFESGILEENANKEENGDARGEETIPDTSNAEGAGRMGEKTAEGKGSNRERISRRIETLLRESSVEGRYNGIKRRGTGRVEKEETAEAFEDRVRGKGYEGYMYAAFSGTSVAFKPAPKNEWNENAKTAAEKLEALGITAIVFEKNLLENYKGVSEEVSLGATLGVEDYLTVFISSKLDADGMETAYHEAFHALLRIKMAQNTITS